MAQKTSRMELRHVPLHPSSERAIDKVLDEAVSRGERWMSICRIVFLLATFVRFFGVNAPWDEEQILQAWLIVPSGACVIAFSVWVIRRTRRGAIPVWLLGLSVAVDATSGFVALVQNPLFGGDTYPGNLKFLDIAALLLVLVVSGFRLSRAVVLLSAALNFLFVAILIQIDITRNPPIEYGPWAIVMVAILLGSATVLAMIMAYQTRALVVAGARDSLRAHRAQQALGSLLQDHHDVRSLLSSANLNAEALLRGLEPHHPLRGISEHLRQDLRAVSALVSVLRESAFQELTAAAGRLPANVSSALRAVTSLVARRFPNVHIECDVSHDLRVHVAGGATVLERVLLNLLVNACEGDGTQGAANVWIRVHVHDAQVHMQVEDDGPGFPEAMLRAPLTHAATSKSDGSGLGLFLIHGVIVASNGRLILGQRIGGGARVEIVLPSTAH